MKKTIFLLVLAWGLMSMDTLSYNKQSHIIICAAEKIDIKIKNDTDDEVSVINAGSGGSYRLTKNATTTIRMEEGDALHYYQKGKKGALILTASKEMNGKVQLLSRL